MQIYSICFIYYSLCFVQKYNIWPTQNVAFTENHDPTLESAGRES